MSKKRKAESDQQNTLLDFFNAGGNATPSGAKRNQGLKKQKTSSKSASSVNGSKVLEENGSSIKSNRKQKEKNSMPDNAEVIELLDSDEDVPHEMAAVQSGPTTPEHIPFEGIEKPHKEVVDLTDDVHAENPPPQPFIDCSTFFLDPPGTSTTGSSYHLPAREGEDEREMSKRLERMSPEEWGLGDDEGFSDAAGTGTGMSEPEDEMGSEEAPGSSRREENFNADEEMELEPADVQLIELSDNEEVELLRTSKETLCPICQRDFVNLPVSVGLIHPLSSYV